MIALLLVLSRHHFVASNATCRLSVFTPLFLVVSRASWNRAR